MNNLSLHFISSFIEKLIKCLSNYNQTPAENGNGIQSQKIEQG